MRSASALSILPRLEDASAEAFGEALAVLGSEAKADLAFVFVSSAHQTKFADLPEFVREHIGTVAPWIGCSGGGVLAGGTEIENAPALAVLLLSLPGAAANAFHVDATEYPDLDAGPADWLQFIGVKRDLDPAFVLLADPFSSRVETLLQGLDFAYPGAPKIGGLASGGNLPRSSVLFCNGRVHRSGSVGVALSGNVLVETAVAQGCRPLGKPMRVTECRDNVIVKLDGEAAWPRFKVLLEALAENQTGQPALHIGVGMDPFKTAYGAGDFLIRNILGYDPASGVVAVGERLRNGVTVQLHLRDRESSVHDLETVLAKRKGPAHQAALLFSCLGRGRHLYGRPNHDSEFFQGVFGAVPIAGFFCNGEIGPVDGTTFLHGYTSSFGLIRGRDA